MISFILVKNFFFYGRVRNFIHSFMTYSYIRKFYVSIYVLMYFDMVHWFFIWYFHFQAASENFLPGYMYTERKNFLNKKN